MRGSARTSGGRARRTAPACDNEAGEAATGGRLSIVATPIGNLDDITLRALRVLGQADCVLAEDTRRTRVLCARHGLTPKLRSFHAHSPPSTIQRLVKELARGAHLALVTDAGTPLLSDPGSRLVRAARGAGIRVEPIPGPSALTCALAGAGVGSEDFRFLGFLPRKGPARRERLLEIGTQRYASVLFEAPSRLATTLEELARLAPTRNAVVCRELTKVHEEFVAGTLEDLAQRFGDGTRGELTLIVGPLRSPGAPACSEQQLSALARSALATAPSPRDAAKQLREQTGIPKREAYALIQSLRSARSK